VAEKLEGPMSGGRVVQPKFDFNCSNGSSSSSSSSGGGTAVGGRLPHVGERVRLSASVAVVTCISWWSSSLRA